MRLHMSLPAIHNIPMPAETEVSHDDSEPHDAP